MTLVNASVYCTRTKQMILQWRILNSEVPDITLSQFFQERMLPLLPNRPACKLEKVYVGKGKHLLDEADVNLCVSPVVGMFGAFIKFIVSSSNEDSSHSPPQNAFQIMLANQQRISASTLPSRVVNPRNRKQKLRNDVLDLLEQNNLVFKHSEVARMGEQFVPGLTDMLWYVDGHHEVFKSRGDGIPSVFGSFTGYNLPEMSKHRKRQLGNMSREVLQQHSRQLFVCLQASYWERSIWQPFRSDVETLARVVADYAEYLCQKNKQMKLVHTQLQPIREVGDNLHFMFLPVKPSPACPDFKELEAALENKDHYQSVQVADFAPKEPSKRYEFVKRLKTTGMTFASALVSYSHGNNVGTLNFIWRVPNKDESTYTRSQTEIEHIKSLLPAFKTRAMRRSAFTKFGRITPKLTSASFQYIYRELTGDSSACANLDEVEIQKRVKLLVDMEDADVVVDLRQLNAGRKSMYDTFWHECAKFIKESVGQAVDDRRHQSITHLATAMSVPDLISQVSKTCPEGTPIPSESWVRLQFWPKNRHWHSSCHYTGKLDIKFMVQTRQLRKSHPDSHYAAAIFRYQREMAVRFRAHSAFVSMDDKHRVSVGEPGYPVAAVERGKRVLVAHNQDFLVADHDFTRFSLVPSVTFLIDIPEEISESWYRGQVKVTLKEAAMQPSSPQRHASELVASIRQEYSCIPPVLFIYTGGGPDHRITYLSVQLSLISIFLALDLDFLCACRTAPAQSWKNPVERVMSILNLGLQSVGLMRAKCSESGEQVLKNCNSLKQIREDVAKQSGLASEIADSIEPVKLLLTDVFQRLALKGKSIKMATPACQTDMQELNAAIEAIEPLDLSGKLRKSVLKDLPRIAAFLEHCCHFRHYHFCVKKCGVDDCQICKPPRLPQAVFNDLHVLPDPVPGDDGHYVSFESAYGTTTSEEHRPSLHKQSKKHKTLPFVASIQHVKNTNLVIQCEECGMWRLVYAKKKLSAHWRRELDKTLQNFDFSCGASTLDLDLPDELSHVHFRDLSCGYLVEKLYYSTGYDPICIYCASEDELEIEEKFFSQFVHLVRSASAQY